MNALYLVFAIIGVFCVGYIVYAVLDSIVTRRADGSTCSEQSRVGVRAGVETARTARPVGSLVLAVIGVATLVMSLPGCAGIAGCTDVGCGSQVTFRVAHNLEVGHAYQVEACSGDFCESASLEVPAGRARGGAVPSIEIGALGLQTDEDIVYLGLPDDENWSGPHHVTLSVRNEAGETVAALARDIDFERLQPNGPDCPPVCYHAELSQ